MDKLLKFEEIFKTSQNVKNKFEKADHPMLKATLHLEYEEILDRAALNYFSFFNDIGIYDDFIEKDIMSYVKEGYMPYREYFSDNFIQTYLNGERIVLFKTLLTKYKTQKDLTECVLSVSQVLISKNWYYSYYLLDIFMIYDNSIAIPFMVKVIEDIDQDEEKDDRDLFMNAISFCIGKVMKGDIYYKRLKSILEKTNNEYFQRNLPYFLNQM
ncbi:hypothetical protein [Aquimarina macrocephali]|uniref:hypothetical protein n=1 Tax=Aquimarina macrocephali TaxID=666563 RepID=UPI003F673967